MTPAERRSLVNAIVEELESKLSVNDLMNSKETAIWLGISEKTLRNNAGGRFDGTYTINRMGERMYYKSKLVEPRKEFEEQLLTSKQRSRQATIEKKSVA